MTRRKVVSSLLSFLVAVAFGARLNAQSPPTLEVDAAANQHPINPNIYGIASYGLDATYAEEIQVPNIRWGGDGTTRYNWEVDSSNAGFDWYFMGGNGETNPVPGASVDLMINTYKPANAGALITIPIIPYVNSTSAWTCSFPTSVYGTQQSFNPYVHPNGEDCGNSISSSGTQLLDTNIYANHINNSVSLQQGWLQHLVSTFGMAVNGGVPFYQLDNEPGGWGNTHRDVEPNGATYNTIISLGQQYAALAKEVDPSAMVLGPSDFTLGGWIGTPSQQNNLYAGQYYLQQMAAYDQEYSERVLDYFDEHYYPQFSSPATQLASTRTFWDSTYNGGTWVEQYYFDGPMQLIPRFRQWIAEYYPGTKLSFSEYSIDSGNKLVTDALAEADLLGIFGGQGVDFANMWNTPAPTDPIAYAFRLFRNYDGQGSQFGNTSVSASSSNQAELSIYGSLRSSDGALILIAINKTTSAIQTSLSLAHFTPGSSAAVYSYSGANLQQISALGNISIAPTGFSYNFPAYSATIVVVSGAEAGSSTPSQISLSTLANAIGIYTDGSTFSTGGLDNDGNAYSAYELGSSLSVAGATFTFAAPNLVNVVKGSSGSVIPLTPGKYSTLAFLGTAVNGNRLAQTFGVTYTDGSSTTFTQSLSDWYTPQHYSGETIALAPKYREKSSGAKDNRTFNLYKYAFPVNNSKIIKSLTLPNNKHVAVIAVTLLP